MCWNMVVGVEMVSRVKFECISDIELTGLADRLDIKGEGE